MGWSMPPGKVWRGVHKDATLVRRHDPAAIVTASVMTFPPEMMPIANRRLAGALLLYLSTVLAGCGEAPRQQTAPPPPAVTVAQPVRRTIVDQDEYVGRFVAVHAVEVRARVSGYLDNVHFQDGHEVKQGELLFTIDKRSFQNTLEQARANLALARSNVAFTEADLARARQLLRDRTISEQVFDQRSQASRNAQASVAANEAMVRQAELELDFTELRAPVAGRIGDRRVTPGNLVTGGTGGNTTLLATVVSTDPIRLEFTFDEASLLRYERLARDGQDVTGRGNTAVRLKLIDEQEFSHSGRMDFVDNVVDRATGTIRARAQFSNSNGLFTPGMFARVQVPGSAPYQALLVPDSAIGTEQARKYVLLVGADNTAIMRYVTLGDIVDRMRVIKQGLSADDRVIITGLMHARAGGKVTPQPQDASPQAAGPQAKATE